VTSLHIRPVWFLQLDHAATRVTATPGAPSSVRHAHCNCSDWNQPVSAASARDGMRRSMRGNELGAFTFPDCQRVYSDSSTAAETDGWGDSLCYVESPDDRLLVSTHEGRIFVVALKQEAGTDHRRSRARRPRAQALSSGLHGAVTIGRSSLLRPPRVRRRWQQPRALRPYEREDDEQKRHAASLAAVLRTEPVRR
jgi:hypothetical protein